MKQTFILQPGPHPSRTIAKQAIDAAPDGFVVQIGEKTRSLEQNSAQWPYLAGFAKTKKVCINGEMVWATDDDWKDILTGAWHGEMRTAEFDGKVIMLPQRTSKMWGSVFSDWMEFLIAMAAQCGVEPVYKDGTR
jgi:NinB protein